MTTALQADWYGAASRQRWYMRQAERPGVNYVARDARITAALRKVFTVTRYRQVPMRSGAAASYPVTALILPAASPDHVRGRL
jgi:hypothetical protein